MGEKDSFRSGTMLRKQPNKHGKVGMTTRKVKMCCICYIIGHGNLCQEKQFNLLHGPKGLMIENKL